jgi:hypothetical protein
LAKSVVGERSHVAASAGSAEKGKPAQKKSLFAWR